MRCPHPLTRGGRSPAPPAVPALGAWIIILAGWTFPGCRSPHPVTLCAIPSAPAEREAQLNPVWERLDENGAPASPRWMVQRIGGDQPLCLPDPDADDVCGKFPKSGGVPRGRPVCNSLASDESPASDVAHGVVCSLGRGARYFSGHLNFMPASYQGLIWFQNHAWPDDDLDFDMLPLLLEEDGVWRLRRHGLTTQRRIEEGLIEDQELESTLRRKGLDYVLHVEAKASESVDRFSQDWWDRFRMASRDERKDMVRGRPAVVTGLLGLDAEHGAFTEIHPAHAVAIQTSCGAPVEGEPGEFVDTWSFFIRNSGNLGWCSQWTLQHMLDPVSSVFTLALPTAFSGEMTQAELVTADTTVLASKPGVERSDLELEGQRLLVRFRWPADLPDAEWLRIHGRLAVRWKAADGAARCLDLETTVAQSPADPVAMGEGPGPPEERRDNAEYLLERLYGESPLLERALGQGDREDVARADIAPVVIGPGEGPCPGGAVTCDGALRAVLADRPVSPPTPDALEMLIARPEICDLAEAARGREDVDQGSLETLLEACGEER